MSVDTQLTLTQGFLPQNRVTIIVSNIMFFNIWNIRDEFDANEHYVGHAYDHLASSFCVIVDFHKGYMVLVRTIDEEHPNPI